jgi:O-antigen ligase
VLGAFFSGLAWLMLLPESTTGSVSAVMVLVGAIGLRRFTNVCPIPRVNFGDVAATAYVALQFVTLLTGTSRANTIHFIVPCVSALCIYFSVRLCSIGNIAVANLFRILTCSGIVLASADLVLLIHGIKLTLLFPPSDISALHASIPLLGVPTRNDGIMVVLAFLPYAIIGVISEWRRNVFWSVISLAATAAIVTVLILSFSRSIDIALAVLFAGWLLSAIRSAFLSIKEICVCCLVVFALVSVLVRCVNAQAAVAETLSWNRTVSQQRSTHGREIIWMDSLSQIEKHPLLGKGGFTDGVNSLERLNTSTLPFTARAYNAPLEVALSSGLLGLLAYASFLLYPLIRVARTLWTRSRQISSSPIPVILASGMIAMIVRDMTYSSLVLNGATMIMAWATVGLIHNALDEETREVAV